MINKPQATDLEMFGQPKGLDCFARQNRQAAKARRELHAIRAHADDLTPEQLRERIATVLAYLDLDA